MPVVVKSVLGSHFGVGAPPDFSGDVHGGYGLLTQGHLPIFCFWLPFPKPHNGGSLKIWRTPIFLGEARLSAEAARFRRAYERGDLPLFLSQGPGIGRVMFFGDPPRNEVVVFLLVFL